MAENNSPENRAVKRTGRRKPNLRNRLAGKITKITAIIVILLILLNLVTPDRTFSSNENRNLEQRPHFTAASVISGEFTQSLTSYLNDQFVLRDTWVSMNHALKAASGQKESGDVYFGKHGTLLARPEKPDETAVSESENAMKAFKDAYPGVSMDVMIVPCAAAAESELLPAYAPVRDQYDDILTEEEQFASCGYSVIKAGDTLREHSGEYIYYKTDHHWTTLGAWYAFRSSEEALGITDDSGSYTDHVVSTDFSGTLASQSGSYGHRDEIHVFEPAGTAPEYYVYIPDLKQTTTSVYDSSKLEEKDQYQVFLGGNHPLVEIHTANRTDRNLLIFKDSYANSFVPFLLSYFDNIYMIDPRYYYDNAASLMSTGGITDVLFLYSQNTFAKDKSLKDVLNDAVSDVSENKSQTESVGGNVSGNASGS